MVLLTEDMVLKAARAPNLGEVVNFNCWGMELSDLSILSQMPEVEVLSLSINNVESLQPFAACLKLRELYLRRNLVANINEIMYLADLPELRVLWLSNNPIALEENYRSTVLKVLPNLTKLDDKDVTEEERAVTLAAIEKDRKQTELAEDEDNDAGDEGEEDNVEEAAEERKDAEVDVDTTQEASVAVDNSSTSFSTNSTGRVMPRPSSVNDVYFTPKSGKHRAVMDAILTLLPLLNSAELQAVASTVTGLLKESPLQ